MVTHAYDSGSTGPSAPSSSTAPAPSRPASPTPPRRPTIVDVARAAGVSTAVVSYALNGRPGVSAATRERVLRVADEFGWRPSAAARSMRTGPRAIGLVLDHGSSGTTSQATDVLEFVIALQEVLATRNLALLLQLVDGPEAAVALYGEWWAERRFDVMVVTDVLVEDPRIDALRRLRAPTVVVGAGQGEHELAAVTVDEGEAFARIGRYLLELGHRHVALVTGPDVMARTHARLDALTKVLDPASCVLVHEATAGTPEAAAAATRRLLTGGSAPTAIVYGSDQMAVAALDVARRSGFAVPWDLSVIAGSDSTLCRLATPSITTLPSAQAELGRATGEAVLAVLDGDLKVRRDCAVGGLAVRGSTAPRSR